MVAARDGRMGVGLGRWPSPRIHDGSERSVTEAARGVASWRHTVGTSVASGPLMPRCRAAFVALACLAAFAPSPARAEAFDLHVEPKPGYHVERRMEPGYAGEGFLLFAATYTPMLAAATIGSSEAVSGCRVVPRSACPNVLAPLFVPVAGPFWMLGRIGGGKVTNWLGFGLALDGLAQAGGLALVAYGLVPHAVLVKHGETSIHLAPQGLGLGLGGTF